MRHTICNLCGKTFDFLDEQENFSMRRLIGYGSRHDGEALSLDLCCDCMDKLIDRCVVSPVVDLETVSAADPGV